MSEAKAVLSDDGVEVAIGLGDKHRLYAHPLDARLGDFLKDVAHDFVEGDVQAVGVSDGKFMLSANSELSRVWRVGKPRQLVFTNKDGSKTLVPVEMATEENSDEESDGEVYERLPRIDRSLSEIGEMRYVLVTGGVLSGIGKGMTASSVGVLLRSLGFRVTAIKIDPYLNVDAGTMSPFEHGEVFVLDDGGETDLDLGNYERFLGVRLTSENNLTTGKVYKSVLEKERRGDYLGKTVQVVPHLTDEIINWIDRVAHVPVDGTGKVAHVCIIELGGTVGDIESAPYIEALRQFQFKISKHCMARVHVSLVPTIGDEEKTKPTQHSVRDLRAAGLHPDIIVCRSSKALHENSRRKIGQFCHMAANHVISAHDITNLYHLPLLLHAQGMHHVLMHQLNLVGLQECDLSEFRAHALALDADSPPVKIALIGKYTDLKDAYISVHKALTHAAMAHRRKLELLYVESADLEGDENSTACKEAWALVKAADGVVVPGGFGDRGIEGKINALKYTRTNKVPTLGVCLGMQLMVVEFARTVLGWKDAQSEEFDVASQGGVARAPGDKATHVVMYMPEISRSHKGGTMRLGARSTLIADRKSLAARLYGGVSKVEERHRHRYEVNPDMVSAMENAGLRFVGQDDTHLRMEIVELPEDTHPFYFGTQFHPEFKSRPGHPSPPFEGLILASSRLALP